MAYHPGLGGYGQEVDPLELRLDAHSLRLRDEVAGCLPYFAAFHLGRNGFLGFSSDFGMIDPTQGGRSSVQRAFLPAEKIHQQVCLVLEQVGNGKGQGDRSVS